MSDMSSCTGGVHCGCVHVELYGWRSLWMCDMSRCTGVTRGIHCGCVTCRVVRVSVVAFTVDV